MMDSYSEVIGVIYCLTVIILISDFIVTLFLAVLCDSFKEENTLMEKEKIEMEEE